MNKKRLLADISGIIFALALVMIGIFFILEANLGLPFLWLLLVIFLAVMLVTNAINFFSGKRQFKEAILFGLGHLVILVLIIKNPSIYTRFIGIVTGAYMLLNGIVYYIDHRIAKDNHLDGVLSKFIFSILYFIFALSLFLVPQRSTSLIFVLSGVYLIIAGIVRLMEAILNILNRKFNVAMALPVVLSALIPPSLYTSLIKDEKFLKEAIDDPSKSKAAPLEVFLYLRDGLFESMGHMDIAYKGTIYSYGLHDPKARMILGSAGDGVLIKVERNSFLKNCLKSGKTIIFDFKLYPSEEDMQIIDQKISDLLKDAYPFYCDSKLEEMANEPMVASDYISDVYRDTKCELYKFNKGRFKTYFVFTTNCVLLADYLIRNKDVDLLNMSGIITPGNYLNYLYRLYLKEDSIVKELDILKKEVNTTSSQD